MSADKKKLLLLFDRPKEPIFAKKGDDSVFEVPPEYLTDRYKPIATTLSNRFGEQASEKIPVKMISIPPLGEILDLSREDNFSLFIPKHQKLADRLIRIFMGVRNTDDLMAVAAYARDRVNPYLFNYAFSVALLHRPDTKDLDVPSIVNFFPDKFFDSQTFVKAREETNIVSSGSRVPIEIPVDYTASDLEPEHKLAYFREDLGVNLHHWHWHLVYPGRGDRTIIDKNRRGELFFYMHQQIIARYNMERLCHGFQRVERWIDWKNPIPLAYFPKLDSLVASRAYPARVANQTIQDLRIEAEQVYLDVDSMYRWRDRIFGAIHQGFVNDESGNRIELTENEGIDILGNIVENTDLSVNPTFYGNLHNMGHMLLAYIHDPDSRHLEPFSTIGDSATAMRDPMFYLWHAYIDDIFQEFKATLPTYSEDRLNYPGVTVTNISVGTGRSNNNVLETFWQQSDVNLSRGMDFQERGSVFARFTHLQHRPFNYTINVNNEGNARKGTCRIFMAPKFDERGNPWLFRDQKVLFVEMDKFTVDLRPGQNTITRSSSDSSVTIPFSRTFRDLDTSRPQDGEALEAFNFCGCGWPDHMLIPRGNPQGFNCQLFVMISNYADDNINQDISGECNDSASFCGLRDKLYPDRRSMGYPFDRMPRRGVDTLEQFLTPNMKVQDVQIRHNNRVERRNTQ